MTNLLALLISLCLGPVPQQAVPQVAVTEGTESSGAVGRLTVAEAAAEIDRLFQQAWQASSVQPSLPATDEEYVRRLYLDLAGRVPAVSEVRAFLDDPNPQKRTALVDALLDSPAFVRHFTILWRNALIPDAFDDIGNRRMIPGFEAWLWTQFSAGVPYDQLVRELLTAPLESGSALGGPALRTANSPLAFYAIRELRPENLATGTARAFLGVRLDCAQCHDHPFDRWKQGQFWSLAAFYSGFSPMDAESGMRMAMTERSDSHSIEIPDKGQTVQAAFLEGEQPEWSGGRSSREVLADWVTSPRNPWFSRMAANRVWALFMGQGIVHPVDDFSENNPASHPEVLQLLADQLVAHEFDLKFLVRTITASRVYQLSSRQTHPSQADSLHFARAAVRGLTPEQLFDSLAEATGYYQPYRTDSPFVIAAETPRATFLELFRDEGESPLQRETTILQALAMMNGDFVDAATSLENSQTLGSVVDFPLMSDEERLETLFLAALSRRPSEAERSALLPYIEQAESASVALADVFWALLNSSEFMLNH